RNEAQRSGGARKTVRRRAIDSALHGLQLWTGTVRFFVSDRPSKSLSAEVPDRKIVMINAVSPTSAKETLLELRCRTEEATSVVDSAVAVRGVEPGSLTLGTDNGSAFT